MQSIQTKYVPCTNTKPERSKVVSASGDKIYPCPQLHYSPQHAHTLVALQFLKEREWVKTGDKIVCGDSPDQKGYCFNIITDYSVIEV